MAAFAIFFTIGLYFRFKEPYNALALFSLIIGAPLACIVWFFKRREKNTQELLKKLNEQDDFEETDNETDNENLNNDDQNNNLQK